MKKNALIALLLWSCSSFAFVFYEDTKIWNQDSITFYFEDGTKTQQHEVKKFAKLWQRYTGIEFLYTKTKPSMFSFKKYYKITFKGNSNQSAKGAVNGTIQLGNLSDNIIFRKTTILHEFGHMLGLGHEHQRTDRPPALDNLKLIQACVKNQRQSKDWCKENFFNIIETEVFIESDYDASSIMHYDLKNITGDNLSMLKTLPKSQFNTLSYTDKYFIAMLYNQNISDKTLEQMHKQDLWNQQKFENTENAKRENAILNLKSSSCKTLPNGSQSKDGKFCQSGYMVIGKDDFSFPSDEFKACYMSFDKIKQQMNNHEYCQLSKTQLARTRQKWSQEFSQFGHCKRLETNHKNRQGFFCKEGYSMVTKDNDMIGEKTICHSSMDSLYKAMQESQICNLDSFGFRKYQRRIKTSEKAKIKTKFCEVVIRKYKHINCPVDFDYTIINSDIQSKPINEKCFASKYQAINAMNEISFCRS